MYRSKYLRIIEDINEKLTVSKLSGNIGLHGGNSGIALFMVYYNILINKKNDLTPKVIDILEHNIKQINSECYQYSICNGISGFGWFCEHLKKLAILKREDIEFLDDLDVFLYKRMINEMKQGNYDYLHGALGIGSYFLCRFDKEKVPEYIENLLTELEKSGISCQNGGIKWLSILDPKTGEKGYNISLSHGISSIAAFLTQLYELNFETERVNKLLTGSIIYILDQIIYTEGSKSFFPSYSKEAKWGNEESRLGWCYGDLGIAYIVWKAAIVLKNKQWENIAIRVFCHNTSRRDLYENMIRDAGLCHGSVGIAHIFNNMYKNTKMERFQKTADYWLNVTTQMGKHNDKFAHFKAFRIEEYGGPVESESLLEGISGIGLALLSHINRGKTTWDECLMLT